MTHRPPATPLLAIVTAAACLGGAAQAQPAGPHSFVSVSPLYEDADLDSGGDFSVGGVLLRGGTSTGFGAGHRIGLTLNYDYLDYSFGDPVAFGGVAPWKVLKRYGFSVPLSFALEDGWSLSVSPQVDWFRENGAKSSDALVWGATVAGIKRFEGNNVLGLGLAAFSGIEENRFFPFPIVNWQFSPRWRLINPLAAGPTGPAGLELDYLADGGWTFGVGAAWRTARYRLSQSGPVPNGIGEISGAPVFLRVSKDFDAALTLNLYVGAVAGGQIRIEDSNGRKVVEEDFDLSPLFGVNLTARF
jgi:hypothetical protein